MSYDYQEKLPNEAATRYATKLKLLGTSCPYKLPADDWKEDPSEWPPLTYHHLYHYLIKSPRLYSAELMENFKSLEAWKFFRSGWVQAIYHKKLDNLVLLKCDVRPSYRTTEKPHKPWVALKNDGTVVAAHCNCMAGLGETCSHVGATLYKIEAAIRIGLTHNAPTDLPCQWNQLFTKSISGAPVAEIDVYSKEAKNKIKNEPKPLPSPPTNADQLEFIADLQQVKPKTVALSLFKESNTAFIDNSEPSVIKLPANLRTFHRTEALSETELKDICVQLKSSMQLTPEQGVIIEEATRNQSLSETWYLQRAGRITGSGFKQAAKANLVKAPVSLILKICQAQVEQFKSPALLWGRHKESVATNLYTKVRMDPEFISEETSLTDLVVHTGFEFATIGLCVHHSTPWYGASPDGAINCKCCGTGVFEVKCPFTLKDKSLKDEILEHDFYVKVDEAGNYFLDKDHQYYYQVQLEMHVSDTLFCDFMVRTPKEFIIMRIDYDDVFIKKAFEHSDVFWENHIITELITRKLENSKGPKKIKGIVNDKTLYCICKSKYDPDRRMVGCDQCNDWFHIDCLKMKRGPNTAIWYCPSCRKERKRKNQSS